jgi:hypothetical protein
MEVLSRAWRTDLALLAGSGSSVEHRGTHVVVRTPDNPGYRWGNVLGVATLVIVADPGYHAMRIYQDVGFRGTETQLQAELVLRRDAALVG